MKDKIHKIIMEYMSDGEEFTPTDKMLLEINKRICALIDADCISRQDAINAVRQYCIDNQIEDGDYHSNGIEYELNNLPSAEHHKLNIAEYIHDFYPDVWRHAEKELEVQPSAERKGKWMEMGTNSDGTHNIKCSKCGEGYKTRGHARSIATKTKYKFCPNCGASMVRGEEDEIN